MSDRGRTLIIRLNKAERKIFPPGSVAANIKALSPEDRAILDRHRANCEAWCAERPGELAYIALLNGEPLPILPHHIADKICPPCPVGTTDEEIYMKLVEEGR